MSSVPLVVFACALLLFPSVSRSFTQSSLSKDWHLALVGHILWDIQKDESGTECAFKTLVGSDQNAGIELSRFFPAKHREILH